jgi:hypothetical protein
MTPLELLVIEWRDARKAWFAEGPEDRYPVQKRLARAAIALNDYAEHKIKP